MPPPPPPPQLQNYPQKPMPSAPYHQEQEQQPPPKQQPLPPFSRHEAKTALPLEANHPLRRQERAKHELAQLHRERRAIVDELPSGEAEQTDHTAALDHVEADNEQWQTPNANLAGLYRLRDEIARLEKQVSEAHGRWDELGERIEELHVEIAFGGSGDD